MRNGWHNFVCTVCNDDERRKNVHASSESSYAVEIVSLTCIALLECETDKPLIPENCGSARPFHRPLAGIVVLLLLGGQERAY